MATLPSKNSPVKAHQELNCEQIEQCMTRVTGVDEALSLQTLDEAAIDAAKPLLAAAQRVWAIVGRRATPEEVAIGFVELFACYPNAPKSTLTHLMAALVEDVLTQKPSIYAVVMTCRALRQKYKFPPTIAEVLTELTKASKRAERYQGVIDGIPELEAELVEAVRLIPYWRAQQQSEDKRRLKVLRRQAREWPPEDFPGCYTADDLVLLGLGGSQ